MGRAHHAADADERALIQEFAAGLVEQLDADELAVFDETAEDYFRDPDGVLHPKRRDESVGFGVEAVLLSPVVLAVAGKVVEYLAGVVAEAVGETAKPALLRLVRRVLRLGHDPEATEPPPLTAAQVEQVRAIALARARDAGLDEGRSRLLAESIVGGVRTA
jgi:hypothetical protein